MSFSEFFSRVNKKDVIIGVAAAAVAVYAFSGCVAPVPELPPVQNEPENDEDVAEDDAEQRRFVVDDSDFIL